jgi:CheY-like chemotaxis protein
VVVPGFYLDLGTMARMRAGLVVDDDPSLAEMLTTVLRGEGFYTR